MSIARRSLVPVVAALAGLCVAVAPARAASNPKAISVRIKCELEGVNGTPDGSTTQCKSLNGWFDGRLDWVSDGVVLFQENGPFVGVQSGTDEVIVFADGNGSDVTFHTFYDDPKTSVLNAPDLTLRLYTGSNGQFTLVNQQRY